MSTIPSICPNCYRNVHSPVVLPDGFIRCDGCGHAFPPAGVSPYASSSSGTVSPAAGSYPNSPPPFASPALNAPSYAPTGYQPPPAAGPQKSGSPGLMACGVIAALGVIFLGCCGGVAMFAYMQAKDIAEQMPPAIAPNPLPGMPVIPSPAQPVFPEPTPFPRIPDPFTNPGPGIPGIPGAPMDSQSLDQTITALKSSSANDPASHRSMQRLAEMPVEEARRAEVVSAILEHVKTDRFGGFNVARPALMKWTSKAESKLLAKFASETNDLFARRGALDLLRETGCDAEAIDLIAPLLGELSVSHTAKETLVKIGTDAEEPVLKFLETSNDLHGRHMAYDVLGEIGTAKSRQRIQTRIDRGDPFDKSMGSRALRALQNRGV